MKFSELLDQSNYRWPKKGDRLLMPSADWNSAVKFDADQIARHVFMWDGYLRAGALLIEECQKNPHDRHILIYPILSSYRQGLELAMKWTVHHYGRHTSLDLCSYDPDHNLWKLWTYCRKVIEEIGGGGASQEDVLAVEQVIRDFHDLDSGGTAFRYAAAKDGRLIDLPAGAYDLENLKDSMDAVKNFFDGADSMLDDLVRSVPSEWC